MHKLKAIELETKLKLHFGKYHHIKDLVKMDLVKLIYCAAQDNVTDLMTKPLGPNRMIELRSLAGLENPKCDAKSMKNKLNCCLLIKAIQSKCAARDRH